MAPQFWVDLDNCIRHVGLGNALVAITPKGVHRLTARINHARFLYGPRFVCKRHSASSTSFTISPISQSRSGVFGGGIAINNLPAHIPLALYIEGEAATEDEGEVWLRISGPGDGSGIMKIGFQSKNADRQVSLATPTLEIVLECEGILKFELSDDQENWEPLIEKKVVKQEGLWTLTPIAPPPPSEQSPPAAPATEKKREPRRRASPAPKEGK